MAFNYTEIDTMQLRADVGQLRDNMSEASSCLRDFMSEINELNSMWKGKANSAFRVQVQQDYEIMSGILEKISRLADGMENAQLEYEKCERVVLSIVDGIQV